MKKVIKISFLLLTMGLYFSNLSFAQQKLGYVDPNILLVSMSDAKSADDAVATFGKPKEADAKKKRDALLAKEQALYKDIESNNLSPNEIRDRKTALQQEYEGIVDFEKKATEAIQTERQRLYAPILKKITSAIEAVAKQEGISMVIDASIGGIILHAEDVSNITDKVAANMGVTLLTPEQLSKLGAGQ